MYDDNYVLDKYNAENVIAAIFTAVSILIILTPVILLSVQHILYPNN